MATNRKEKLTSKAGLTKVVSLREVIDQRREELGWSAYRLAKAVSGQMTAQAVYDFLANRSDTRSDNIAAMLAALGLQITVAPDSKPDSKLARARRKQA